VSESKARQGRPAPRKRQASSTKRHKMSQRSPGFDWTAQRVQAATLVAQDELTDEQIAEKLGVDRRTLARWKESAPFQETVQALVEQFRQATSTLAIADKQQRVAALDDRWRRMRRVIDERATFYGDLSAQHSKPPAAKGRSQPAPAAAAAGPEWVAPGAGTGLLVHTMRSIGAGDNASVVTEWEVDTSLLREMRGHEEQAAKELGQWTEKSSIQASGSAVVFLEPREIVP
jgi:transcriptional regulator with XRE-family HTH domain